jgi:hypothetical protein
LEKKKLGFSRGVGLTLRKTVDPPPPIRSEEGTERWQAIQTLKYDEKDK